ncbi:MAG: hypothetical protein ACSHX6_05220 [Akkermansiaceae bacterium]
MIAIAVVGGVIFLGYRVHRTVREAYASEWVAGHVIRYMEANNGRWPERWEDLRPIHDQAVLKSRDASSWSFEMLQRHVIVDWNADPAKLVKIPKSSGSPPFQVIRGRHGAYWSGMEPNRLIHEWLLTNLDSSL